MSSSQTIETETIERIVREVNPDWRVTESRPADRGVNPVYHLAVDTGGDHGNDDPGDDGRTGDTDEDSGTDHTWDGTRELVLKAGRDDDEAVGVRVESRLLPHVGANTEIPVPEVVGVVDEHDELPSPALLMESMPGAAIPQRDVVDVRDELLYRVARESGGYLARLHRLDAVDGYGFLDCDPSPPLSGGRPPTDGSELVLGDGDESWAAVVRDWASHELDRHAESRFDDLTERFREALLPRVETLPDDANPVLSRIDHGLHNLLVDRDAGRVTAVLDWAFTLAATPGYDLATVSSVLAGGPSTALPGAPDRRDPVRRHLEAGYRSVAGALPRDYREHRRTYDLLTVVRSMNHVESGITHVRDENRDAAARGMRDRAESLLVELDG